MTESLENVRIWLSGSIPDEATAEQASKIHGFVAAFAKEVFRRNGRLVHGSHPTIRETLLQAAREYQDQTGRKAGLVLVVSRFYSKSPQEHCIDIAAWNDVCLEKVIETREALADPVTGEISREQSLHILRDTLVEQANTIVAVGGRWWQVAMDQAGVPDEIELAADHHLPLFLLGGLGGATKDYLQTHPEVLRACQNGLTAEENLALSQIDSPEELSRRVADQIARLPLRARTPDSGRPFRILCLDGGGIRGAFTASVLKFWEEATGRRAVDHFDLISGTSTGGILAIGLGLGMCASEMLEFYKREGGAIFPVEQDLDRLWHSFKHWFSAKFDRAVLAEKLNAAYQTAPQGCASLDNSLCRLLIPAYNTEADTLILFRTTHGRDGAAGGSLDPVEVAQATAAAPTYFDPVKIGHLLAVDGGVWANSPTTVALAEATHELGVSSDRIEMLSIGTTSSPSLEGQPLLLDKKMVEALLKPLGGVAAKIAAFAWKPTRVQGTLGWIPNIAGFLMKTQAQTADHVCKRILGDRFLRVDKQTVATSLDDPSSIDRLIALGEEAARDNLQEVKIRFMNGLPADSWK